MIQEVKTAERKWPCCPLMSGAIVQVQPPPNAIMQPNQMAVGPMMVPCVEDDCPLYDPQAEVCGLQAFTSISYNFVNLIGFIADIKLIFEPPKDSPSPLMRLAQAVEALVENSKKKG